MARVLLTTHLMKATLAKKIKDLEPHVKTDRDSQRAQAALKRVHKELVLLCTSMRQARGAAGMHAVFPTGRASVRKAKARR